MFWVIAIVKVEEKRLENSVKNAKNAYNVRIVAK